MSPALAFAVVAVAAAAPVPKDAAPTPTGPPPRVVFLRANGPDGQVPVIAYRPQKVTESQQVTTVKGGKPVTEVVKREVTRNVASVHQLGALDGTFGTAGGETLTAKDVAGRVKTGAAVLVSADGNPVDPGWLRLAGADAVVIRSAALAGPVAPRSAGGRATTAAPWFAVLAPDPDGVVRVAAVEPGASRATFRVGPNGVAERVEPAPPTKKPLEEVGFDAYTADGVEVSKGDVLRRLAAGGVVVFTGDGKKPDAAFLKAFRPEVLILSTAEVRSPDAPVGPTAGIINRPALVLPAAPLPAPAPAPVPPAAPGGAAPALPPVPTP